MTITNLSTPEFVTIPKNTKSNQKTAKSDQRIGHIWVQQGPRGPVQDYTINPVCNYIPYLLKGQDDVAMSKVAQFDKMNDACFPAVVYIPTFNSYNSTYPLSMIFPGLSGELYGLLDFLGYRCAIIDDQFHLYLPTVKTLNKRWEDYRQLHKDQNLPPLKLISSKGIESDKAFIKASFTADAIISENVEAVHDHELHVLPLLANVLAFKAQYPIIREKMRDLIRQGCEEPLQIAKEAGLDLPYAKLRALEGGIVDRLLSYGPAKIKDIFEKTPFENAWATQLIREVEEEFLYRHNSLENRWITYFQARFRNFDPNKIFQEWMVVQSRGILHKAHLLSDANIYALKSYPNTATLSKAMLGLLKEGLLTQPNFELLCQLTPQNLSTLESALAKFHRDNLLETSEFSSLLRIAASLGFTDLVDTLLKLPIAYKHDQHVHKGKAAAFEAALESRHLACALRLLEDKKILKHLNLNKALKSAARSLIGLPRRTVR